MLARGDVESDQPRTGKGAQRDRPAVHLPAPAGPIEGREQYFCPVVAGSQSPRLARTVAFQQLGRFEPAADGHDPIALARVEPGARPRPRIRLGREILGADGRADVAREPFVLGQPLGRHVGVRQDEVVGLQTRQAGKQHHKAPGDGDGRADNRALKGEHDRPDQQRAQEGGHGQKSPGELREGQ